MGNNSGLRFQSANKLRLSSLSIADLIALHTNYWLSKDKGARFCLLNEKQFESLEKELTSRISNIVYEL
mgnify:CR=1 FL=1